MTNKNAHYLGTVPMEAGPLGPMIERNYTMSHAFQWAREAVVNSAQAGATKIRFTTEWQAAQRLGVHRRMIIDDGPGIPRANMAAFLARFGGSGKTLASAGENFGIGLKTSLLPWNTHGLVLISKTENGEVSMMWMYRDDTSLDEDGFATYGGRLFDVDSDDHLPTNIVALDEWNHFHAPEDRHHDDHIYDEQVVDWTRVFPKNQKSGFAIILLGDNPLQNTVTGDPHRNEQAKYGLTQYLNARFWTYPINIEVTQYENYSDPSTWPTAPVGGGSRAARQNRNGQGLKYVIETANCGIGTKNSGRDLDASGMFEIAATKVHPGVRIHWWLAKNPVQERGDIVTMPMTGILHTSHEGIDEVYDLAGMGENITTVNAKTRMNQFVMVNPVRDRLAIIFEPLASKRFKVYPEQSRTKVLFENETSGAQSMPWDEWAAAWRKHLPKPIKDAIDAYYEAAAERTEGGESLRDLLAFGSQHADRLHRITAPVGDFANGTVFGKAAATPARQAPGGAKKPSAKKTPADRHPSDPGNEDTVTLMSDQQRKKAANLGLILCVTVNEPQEEHVLRYDPTSKRTLLNVSHPMWRSIVDDVVFQYVAAGRLDEDDTARRTIIENTFKVEAQRHITLGGSQAVVLAAADPTRKDQILSPYALQAMLYGIRHLETLAAKPIGQRIGGKKAETTSQDTEVA